MDCDRRLAFLKQKAMRDAAELAACQIALAQLIAKVNECRGRLLECKECRDRLAKQCQNPNPNPSPPPTNPPPTNPPPTNPPPTTIDTIHTKWYRWS